MRPIAFGILVAATHTGFFSYWVPTSGQAEKEAGPIYGIKIPEGYRNWQLISVNHLAGGNLKQVRARPIGQRYCDKGLSGREASVPGRRNNCRAALERSFFGRKQ